MIHVEDSVEVGAAAAAAFAFVARVEDYPAWLPGVERAERLEDPSTAGGQAGTTPSHHPAADAMPPAGLSAGTAPPARTEPAADTGSPAHAGSPAGYGLPASPGSSAAAGPDAADGVPGVGSRFRLAMAGPGGMAVTAMGRVEAVDPPRSISISATSGLFGLTATCAVEPLGSSTSRIRVRADVEPRGLAKLAAGRIEEELRAAVPDTLRRLREALEDAPAP